MVLILHPARRRRLPTAVLLSALGATLLACGTVGTTSTTAAPLGQLDTAFGGGIVQLPQGTQLNGAAVARDGRLVVTGLAGGGENPRLLVARFTPNGALDPSFGAGGFVLLGLPGAATGTIGEDVAIQPDGKIVVAGDVRGPSGADGMLVARLAPNGAPDPGFGGGGTVALLRGVQNMAEANAVAIRSDGQILVGGAAGRGGPPATAALVRLNPSGGLVGAVRRLNVGQGTIEGLALKRGGDVAVAGSLRPDQTTVPFIGQVNADGSKDLSFAERGIYRRSYARDGAAASGLRDVAVQPDGSIVATGYALDGSGGQSPGAYTLTVRVDEAGNPDGSFGPRGACYTRAARSSQVRREPPPGGAGIAFDRGYIYSGGGWSQNAGASALSVVARRGSGATDRGFGSGGQTVLPVRNYSAQGVGNDLALSPQGIYLVGTTGLSFDSAATTGVIARVGGRPFAFATPPATAPRASPSGTGPSVSGVSLSRGRISTSSRGRRSTTLRYRLSRSGSVRITVERRRTGQTCSGKRSRSAYYEVYGGARTVTGRRGRNSRRVTRRVTTRSLPAGRYRVVVQGVRGGKAYGSPRSVSLRVGG